MDLQVASTRHDCSSVLNNIEVIASDLANAKATIGHALCLCTTPPRRLQIRTINTRLFLAVWPFDGHHHHYACPFHRDEISGGVDPANTAPSLREDADGWDIRPDFQLLRVANSLALEDDDELAAVRGSSQADKAPRKRRSKMGLLGILQHLWAEAQLNRWGAGWTRNYWRVTKELLPHLQAGTLGGRALTEWLYLVPEFTLKRKNDIDAAWLGFKDRMHLSAGELRCGLILGEVKDLHLDGTEFKLSLRHHAQPIFMTLELRNAVATSYPRALHQIALPHQRVVCLALVEQKLSGHVCAIDVALMATSLEYIPVDSSYEAALAHRLVAVQRAFFKPLKLSEASSMLPDFVLTDAAPPCVLEVFGMTTPEYLERKAQKLETYKSEGKPVWQWTTTTNSEPPTLPPIALGPTTR